MRDFGLFVNGQYVQTQKKLEIRPPQLKSIEATFKVSYLHSESSSDELSIVEAALEGASQTFQQLENGFFSLAERLAFLERLKSRITAQEENIAQTLSLEVAKPISLARAEVRRAVSTLEWTLIEATRVLGRESLPGEFREAWRGLRGWVQRDARGPLLAISPFNFPINLVMHKLAPAIAAGCPVILKPSPKAAVTALLIADLCLAEDLPAGMLSVLQCDNPLTLKIAKDERISQLSFTGSAKVGWELYSQLKKPSFLELGGTAPAFVDKSADLKDAAQKLVAGAFSYSGQVCISVQNISVDQSVAKEFKNHLKEEVEKFPWGEPSEEKNLASCVIDSAAAEKLGREKGKFLQQGAQILAQAPALASSSQNFVRPAIFAQGPKESSFVREEIFGPYANIFESKDFQSWVSEANASPYRLQASVFCKDSSVFRAAAAKLRYGGVIINDSSTLRIEPMPYGGCGLSGIGREGPRYAMQEFTELKSVLVHD